MWRQAGVVAVTMLFAGQLMAETHNARGLLVATHQATLSSELAARVIALPKKMGESFQQGDTLVALDCRLFEAQHEKVGAEVKVAQIRLENSKQLNQLRSIGTLEVAIAESELQKIAAEQRIAQLNVERCDIKAPFDGAVEQLDIHRFEVVQQQQALMKIVGRTQLEADIIVPAEWMAWLKVGKKLQLQAEETQHTLQALVSHISPSVDPTSQTVQIRATIKNVPASILPGMSVLAIF
ncbi:efflux RND transporter periplasmic adaptor subunit [Marinomonas sp. M1K-6]|uniref:Efflux RND transporter periplasmic adaptor subunit n=1 Tax=Marinomonas profundi TaxID=2726122 RepID=A0A847R5Z6_9GAMM|nr:efflux RND transporter periplasmic adaptor subunit [Marinomonas profundi]NLQ17933.1 efflux RND transporter periplasmic adaptor subunit [Marinomonas profundi]UDV03413.1 efflux RND transporter periplasmic adaptor subunit [Marinomonas profundi]